MAKTVAIRTCLGLLIVLIVACAAVQPLAAQEPCYIPGQHPPVYCKNGYQCCVAAGTPGKYDGCCWFIPSAQPTCSSCSVHPTVMRAAVNPTVKPKAAPTAH